MCAGYPRASAFADTSGLVLAEPALDVIAGLVAAGDAKQALMAPGIWG
jgi:hypothetical protein